MLGDEHPFQALVICCCRRPGAAVEQVMSHCTQQRVDDEAAQLLFPRGTLC